jgi:hypothetical protein
MIYITHIRLAGGTRHEHITHLAWKEGTKTGESTRAELVQWVNGGGDARVQSTPKDVKVEVVNATPPYLRTVANGTYTDNLLYLPRF